MKYVKKEDRLNFIHSQKGKLQLCDSGYVYVREKIINNRTYWRCAKYTTKDKCYGRVHTTANSIVTKSNHNHEPLFK